MTKYQGSDDRAKRLLKGEWKTGALYAFPVLLRVFGKKCTKFYKEFVASLLATLKSTKNVAAPLKVLKEVTLLVPDLNVVSSLQVRAPL